MEGTERVYVRRRGSRSVVGRGAGSDIGRSYTQPIRVLVSIPDSVFAAAEKLADRLGISRSQLYARALSELLGKWRDDRITEELNRVHGQERCSLNPAMARLQTASLLKDHW